MNLGHTHYTNKIIIIIITSVGGGSNTVLCGSVVTAAEPSTFVTMLSPSATTSFSLCLVPEDTGNCSCRGLLELADNAKGGFT